MQRFALVLSAWLLLTGAAAAEVTARADTGFQSRIKGEIAAPPAKVYAALGQVSRWWDPAHTYSGKAANLSLPLQPGACFCERLPQGGGVRHGVVVLAMPSSTLRLEGALGPLQAEGVSTALTFDIKPKGAGSDLTVTYNVGGYRADGVRQWAEGVDQVLQVQVKRLARFSETGKP